MKRISILAAALLVVSGILAPSSLSQEASSEQQGEGGQTSPVDKDLAAIVEKLNGKLEKLAADRVDREGLDKALRGELKAFDDLAEKYKGDKEAVSKVLLLKAAFLLQVLEDLESAAAALTELSENYANTAGGERAAAILPDVKRAVDSAKVRANLKPGATFPDFTVTDLEGEPLSISQFQGKVVLVDFWATWCGPCIVELPNVLATYKEYHDDGFEIVGISLDKDKEALLRFLKKHRMTWPQYFDGAGWQNKLAEKYGVNSIPATFLLDREGKIVATDLRGPELNERVGELVGKKAK